MWMKTMPRRLLCASGLMVLGLSPVGAAERHEHGHADVEMALEAQTLHMHWRVPTESFMGFGHAPVTEQEQATWQRGAVDLRNAAQWIQPEAQAQCQVTQVAVDLPYAQSGADADEAHGQNDDHDHDHDHDKGHDHDAAHGAAAHSDIEWSIAWTCAQAAKLSAVHFDVFKRWPRLHVLHVQMVGPQGQSSATVTPEQSRMRW